MTGQWDDEKKPTESYQPTLGCWDSWTTNTFGDKEYKIHDINPSDSRLNWWECIENDDYEMVDCLQSAEGAFLLFDSKNGVPLDVDIEKERVRVERIVGRKIPMLVVLTKCDDAVPGNDVSQDGIIRTSALENINVRLAFRILDETVRRMKSYRKTISCR